MKGAAKLNRINPAVLANNPRASLSAWLKYEPVVVGAFKMHPKVYRYRPTSMAPVSVTSKIRDAIRGKLAFDYPCEISTHDLARWFSEVVFKHDGEYVIIGPAEKIQETLQGDTPQQNDSARFIYPELSLDEVLAFTVLLSSNRISGPVVVQQPPDLTLLPERPNVETIYRPDGSLVLL